MNWSFAIINGKLAEIFFDLKKNGDPVVKGHCYIKRNEFKTKREKLWIKSDTKRNILTYRGKKYFDQVTQKWID